MQLPRLRRLLALLLPRGASVTALVVLHGLVHPLVLFLELREGNADLDLEVALELLDHLHLRLVRQPVLL